MKQKLSFLFTLLFALTANTGYSQAKLYVTDVSHPKPMNLNVGNVGEYVYELQDIHASSTIDSIFFHCSANPNIVYYPIGHPLYYLTHSRSVLTSNYSIYSYPYSISSPPPNSYSLNTTGINIIDTTAIKAAIGSDFLNFGDTLFLHIPFFVTSCDSGLSSNNFYLDSLGHQIDYTVENTDVNIGLGNPGVLVTAEILDSATFCPNVHKDTSKIGFLCKNTGSGVGGFPAGDGRMDSLRLYMFCNIGAGIINVASIKINGVSISSAYITQYTNNGQNIYLINLTKYPAGASGQPFGLNTLCDLDGDSIADAMAEGNTFEITADFIYNIDSCPPYVQLAQFSIPNTFYLPGIWVHYNNMCFTKYYDTITELPLDTLQTDAAYEYISSIRPQTSISAPSDVTNNFPNFNLTICPSFRQEWSPTGFDFDCPKPDWTIVIPLPKGYHLDTASAYLHEVSHSSNPMYSSNFTYIPTLFDSSTCDYLKHTLNPPTIYEQFIVPDSSQGTVYINYGRLPVECMNTNIPSCINVPLALTCSDFSISNIYTAENDQLYFYLEYTCDSLCASCPNLLTADTLIIYHHCEGSCTSIPFTDSVWTFYRTNWGDSNIIPPLYYSSCNPPLYPNPLLKVKDTLPLVYEAAYPGDQIEAKVNGGYGSLRPLDYSDEYLQIRYERILGDPTNLFELDPSVPSYFIIRNCVGVPALNGLHLLLPPTEQINEGINPVEMNFSMDSAILFTNPSLYALWIADTVHESITDSAYMHLRVIQQQLGSGKGLLNLRTEYMCKHVGPDSSGDSIHSCDSWGRKFDLYQPFPVAGLDLDAVTSTNCDSLTIPFRFLALGALNWTSGQSDFPNEFRPFAELDSIVEFVIPKGYKYTSAQFYVYLNRFDINSSNNHFKGGDTLIYFPIKIYTQTNLPYNPNLPTDIFFKGLDSLNPCWPIIDEKTYGYQDYSNFVISVNVQPICSVQDTETVFCNAGYIEGTQQPNISFQHHVTPIETRSILQHSNPSVYVAGPGITIDYSNVITFGFDLCDNFPDTARNAWVAIENVAGDLFNMGSAKLYNYTTSHYILGIDYKFGADSGVIFNLGKLSPSICDSLVFSALIDSNSKSCPPPVGGYNGKTVIRFGNICSGTLINPDSSICQNSVDTFYYKVYPTTLTLTADSSEPSPVSLCGGSLTEYLTIKSANLGTISNPLFWVVAQPGDTITSITFTYPCGGANDTNVHVPDIVRRNGYGVITETGWNLNRDLKMHGLRGTLGLSPTSDSNTICAKVVMAMNCNYHGKPIIDSVSGISTCSEPINASASITPNVDSSCCESLQRCWADKHYDTIFTNKKTSSLTVTSFYKKNILIVDTFTVNSNFTFNSCDISFAPKAFINVINNSLFRIVNDSETIHPHDYSYLHAACDTMWRGIFIYPGSELFSYTSTLIEDADSAIVSINNSTDQGIYTLREIVLNKNYKDIVVRPCPNSFGGLAFECIFTCRDFSAIPLWDVWVDYLSAPPTTLLPPHSPLPYSYMGMDIDSVHSITVSDFNVFDNKQYGIKALGSTLIVNGYNTFQSIGFTAGYGAGIIDTGAYYSVNKNTLTVDSNDFYNCYNGILASDWFETVTLEDNIIYDSAYTASIGAYGVYVAAMDYPAPADMLNIEENTITNFNKGIAANMNTYVTGNINYNTISENICNGLNWIGIYLNELSTSNTLYNVYENNITSDRYGVAAVGIRNSNINDNLITLGAIGCPYTKGAGIAVKSGTKGIVGCNVISTPDDSNSYTGIVESLSTNLKIINDSTSKDSIHIRFNGGTFTGDNALDNKLHIGNTGILCTSGAMVSYFIGTSTDPADNTFDTLWSCQVFAPISLTYYYFFHNPTGCTGFTHTPLLSSKSNPCPSVPLPPTEGFRTHSAHNNTNDSNVVDSATVALMEKTALSQVAFGIIQDTNAVLAKEGVINMLWQNPYLLSNPILSRFNDSISNASLGQILAVDTTMASVVSTPNYSMLLNKVSSIVPANNIEANMQTATAKYLLFRLNNSLSQNDLTTLRTLANKCPDWDGIGVYEARAILSLFDSPTTEYPEECDANRNEHRADKQNGTNQADSISKFNLYPNPNNGGFTLEYKLQKGQTGEFIIYSMLGEKLAEYKLAAYSNKMKIINEELSAGVYLYNIRVDNALKKRDKLVIMK